MLKKRSVKNEKKEIRNDKVLLRSNVNVVINDDLGEDSDKSDATENTETETTTTNSNSNSNGFTDFLPPASPDRPFLTSLLCSIFEPGVNSSLRLAIHFAFLSLIAVHIWLVYLTEGRDIHVWVLMGLNVILYPSLLIFINLAYTNPK